MMGTGAFALPTFEALYQTRHEVVGLVTQPKREEHGRREASESPLRRVAETHGTPILDPQSINTDEARAELAALRPDLLVVADYGQILSDASLLMARLGGINLHGSLLPKYRGAAPVNWALLKGEAETGVTVIQMTTGLDAGPALAQGVIAIEARETAVELEQRLSRLGAPLIAEIIDQLAEGKQSALPQDQSQATRAPRLKKQNGVIDWSRTATEIHNQVRGLEPWPRTFTFWHRKGATPLRMILFPVEVVEWAGSESPGTVLEAAGDRLVIATGGGALRVLGAQPAGKRALGTAEFLRGYPVQVGDRFGPEGP
jgi:methionyl-tRNA formyltransferase